MTAVSKARYWDTYLADCSVVLKAVKMAEWLVAQRVAQTAARKAVIQVVGSVAWRAAKWADEKEWRKAAKWVEQMVEQRAAGMAALWAESLAALMAVTKVVSLVARTAA